MEPPLVIRLSVEHMQYQIMQAIYPHETELRDRVKDAVQNAVASFDFNAEVTRQVEVFIQRRIQEYASIAISTTLNKGDSHIEKLVQAEVERQLKGRR